MGKTAGRLALALQRRPQQPVANIGVHMLVSSQTWEAGLLAAASFEHHTDRRWSFFIHEDGTIREKERRSIRKMFPDARLISRDESDAKAHTALAAHPHCLAHRSRYNLFLKFADFAAFTPGERFIVLDSDVLFFRRPEEILDWVEAAAPAFLYNVDSKEKYCIPREVAESAPDVNLPSRFNSGVMLLPHAAIDFSLAEAFISRVESAAHHPQFFEQTLYALMAGASGKSRALPETYDISWNYFRRKGAVCRHYIGDFKNDLFWIEGAPLLFWSVLRKRGRTF